MEQAGQSVIMTDILHVSECTRALQTDGVQAFH